MLTAACPLDFDAEAHAYRLHGVPVPSVTTVLKATGYIRLAGIFPSVLERARARGQRVHMALHYLFEDDLDLSTVDEETQGYLLSAQKYLDAYVKTVYRAEMRVWSERHAFAGTLDILALHSNNRLFIGDFKTGDPADVAADIQTGAYLGAMLEMAASDPELLSQVRSHSGVIERRSIRLFGDGRVGRETPYTDSHDYSRFLNALTLVHDQATRPTAALAWDDER